MKINSNTSNTLHYYGRVLLFIPATLHTLLTVWVIGLLLAGGGNEFMRVDFGGAWIMLLDKYPNVAEDFLHTMKNSLVGALGVGLFSLAVLSNAFNRGERWSWFIMWFLPASMINNILYAISRQSGFEYFFGGLVVLAVLGLLISFRAFFPGQVGSHAALNES